MRHGCIHCVSRLVVDVSASALQPPRGQRCCVVSGGTAGLRGGVPGWHGVLWLGGWGWGLGLGRPPAIRRPGWAASGSSVVGVALSYGGGRCGVGGCVVVCGPWGLCVRIWVCGCVLGGLRVCVVCCAGDGFSGRGGCRMRGCLGVCFVCLLLSRCCPPCCLCPCNTASTRTQHPASARQKPIEHAHTHPCTTPTHPSPVHPPTHVPLRQHKIRPRRPCGRGGPSWQPGRRRPSAGAIGLWLRVGVGVWRFGSLCHFLGAWWVLRALHCMDVTGAMVWVRGTGFQGVFSLCLLLPWGCPPRRLRPCNTLLAAVFPDPTALPER